MECSAHLQTLEIITTGPVNSVSGSPAFSGISEPAPAALINEQAWLRAELGYDTIMGNNACHGYSRVTVRVAQSWMPARSWFKTEDAIHLHASPTFQPIYLLAGRSPLRLCALTNFTTDTTDPQARLASQQLISHTAALDTSCGMIGFLARRNLALSAKALVLVAAIAQAAHAHAHVHKHPHRDLYKAHTDHSTNPKHRPHNFTLLDRYEGKTFFECAYSMPLWPLCSPFY